MPEKKYSWDDVEQLPKLIEEAWTRVIIAREALNVHMQKEHGGKYLKGCHDCPKLTVTRMDEQANHSSLSACYQRLLGQ